MNVPYLMQLPEQDELWIVDGERRFLITPQVYDLIVGNGGELPPAYGIEKLQEENAKLRELAERAWKTAERLCQAFDGPCRADDVTAYKPCPMGERDEECVYGQLQMELRELGVEVN